MKTLEELKAEMDAAYWVAANAGAAAHAVARHVRAAYYKKLKEIEDEDS